MLGGLTMTHHSPALACPSQPLISLSSPLCLLSPKPLDFLLKFLHNSLVLLHVVAKLPLHFCLDF